MRISLFVCGDKKLPANAKASRCGDITVVRFELPTQGRRMKKSRDRIPDEFLKKSFPKRSKEVWVQNAYTAN